MQPATKRATPKKPTTTTPFKQTKPAPPPLKKPSKQKGEREGDDADLERAIKLSLDPAFQPKSRKGKAVVSEEQIAHSLIDLSKKKRTTDQFILARLDQTPPDSRQHGPYSNPYYTSDKEIYDTSPRPIQKNRSNTEPAAPKGDKDQDEVDTSTVTSGVSIPVSAPEKAHEALAGPDPEPMEEDQTGSDSGKLHVSLLLPNPEPYEKSFNFGDQFLHDKPTEDDQEKSKDREESDSTIPDSSHQTVTSTPPVIAPFTEKYYVLPGPSLSRIKNLKRVRMRIIKAKKGNQYEGEQDSTYSSESFDSDEDAIDKEVADKLQDHKRKHILMIMRSMMMMKIEREEEKGEEVKKRRRRSSRRASQAEAE
ncbi:hypothetical protein Tco_0123758 [Tanacetum coccineum]